MWFTQIMIVIKLIKLRHTSTSLQIAKVNNEREFNKFYSILVTFHLQTLSIFFFRFYHTIDHAGVE